MEGIVKICKIHGELLITDVIKSGKNKSGTPALKCRRCMSDFHKRHYAKNKEKVDEAHRIYKEKNLEKFKIIKKESAKKNIHKHREKKKLRERKNKLLYPEKVRDRQKRFSKKGVQQLKDWYVKKSFTANTELKSKDIPDEVVKLKRVLMKLNRNLKEGNKCQK